LNEENASYPDCALKVYRECMGQQESSASAVTLQFADFAEFVREAGRRQGQVEEQHPPPSLYRIAFGLEPILLGNLEFRILMLLASKPYYPFSAQSIAAAVTTERQPVAETAVDQHIAALREQLGFFRDYVQTVPYMGYRFKA
jgi:DNA-binding response OmpR family regulator